MCDHLVDVCVCVPVSVSCLQTLSGLLASLENGTTVNIAMTPTGYDISSNTESGAGTARAIMAEIIRNVQEELFPEVGQ